MKKDLVGVVLAGGVGNRFFPLSNKVVFPFFGKTLLEHMIIRSLPKAVTRIVIVANPANYDLVKNHKFPVPTVTVIQKHPSGMADALLSAESEIHDCRLLIFIADDVVESRVFKDVCVRASHSNVFGVLPGLRTTSYIPSGYLKIQGDRILDIIEKPGEGNEPSRYTDFSGHYIKDSNLLLQELKRTSSENDDVYERALSALMKHQEFIMVPYIGQFASLKYPWQVLDAMHILFQTIKNYRGKNIRMKNNVVIEGKVFIGNNVKIFENTKIVGPAYIGDNTIIGNNNLIRESHIGPNSISGFNTDITRSYIGDNCWFHSNYIGDSVLEGNVSLGSGTVLANLRLDEGVIRSEVKNIPLSTGKNKLGAMIGRDVRIGVNTSVMPGIKIGSQSYAGAGLVIDSDIPEGSFCAGKTESRLKRNSRTISASNRDEFRKRI